MKIKSLTVTNRWIPFRESYGISSRNFDGETFLIAQLHTECGQIGLSDSVNSVPFGPESPETMRHVLFDHLMPVLKGCDPRDHEDILKRMAAAIPGHPMAKAIIDIACHDLASRDAEQSLQDYLGGGARDELALCGAIGISNTARMEAEAAAYVEKGMETLKVKIGTSPAQDYARIAAIRSAVGPDIKIRVDANQGCTLDEWLPTFRKFDDLYLEFLEQPLPVWDIKGAARLQAELATPILADESVYTPDDLVGLLDYEALGAVNIKLLKTGLTNGRKIMHMAQDAGLPIVIGSMFETGIGTAASVQFAAGITGQIPATECGFPAKLASDVIAEEMDFNQSSIALSSFSGAKGLGVTLAEDP